MTEKLDVFEVTFECTNPECKLEAIETTTDLFNTLYQRCCGNCGCSILKLKRCKHIFGDPIPHPDRLFELKPEEPEK